VGRRSQNVGITNLAIRRSSFGSADYQAFVSLVNYSPEPQTFAFALELDGRTIAEKDVTLEPSVRRSIVLPFGHGGGGVVTARLRIDDDLTVDDVAYAVLPPPRKMNVLLVSPGNLFLEKVLRTDPQVSLEVRTSDQYAGGMAEADVAVLDSVTPPRVGPGRFVFVNAVPPDVPLEVLGRIERPTIMDWDRAHPIMRHVEFAKVAIEDAMRIRPLAAARPRRRRRPCRSSASSGRCSCSSPRSCSPSRGCSTGGGRPPGGSGRPRAPGTAGRWRSGARSSSSSS